MNSNRLPMLPPLFTGELPSPAAWEKQKSHWKTLLQEQEYGFFPAPPTQVSVETILKKEELAGKATLYQKRLYMTVNGHQFSFPFHLILPNKVEKPACVVHISFRGQIPDWYQPSEEICDRGVAVASFCYTDITTDDGDFTNGLAGIIYPDGNRPENGCGKLVLWAYAAMQVLEVLLLEGQVDPRKIGVAGHSRLGKTALVAGAFEERFAFVYANNSGCGGASVHRMKKGESISRITTVFPFWFCKNFANYSDKENDLSFDQHTLLALIAPRKLAVGGAALDEWADPESEYLSAIAASPAYEIYGKSGLIHCGIDAKILPGTTLQDGSIGLHLREGTHYFSRYDWNRLLDFLEK